MTRPIITLTTDFGAGSGYVAQMKGVILSLNAEVNIVDVSHDVLPQDIRHGALLIADVWRRFPPRTTHIVVVDPGVGSARDIVLLTCEGHHFIAPDNGVLTLVAESAPPERILALDRPNYWLDEVSSTFHGRDIMSPTATHLSLGVSPDELGSKLDELICLEMPCPTIAAGRIEGEVILVDSFGNLVTNIDLSCLMNMPPNAAPKVACKASEIVGLVETYAEASPGRLAALVGSAGRLELAVPNGNAAAELAAKVGDRVVVTW